MQLPFETKPDQPSKVSRRRYLREKSAREEAEVLLEQKSRALWDANQVRQFHIDPNLRNKIFVLIKHDHKEQ